MQIIHCRLACCGGTRLLYLFPGFTEKLSGFPLMIHFDTVQKFVVIQSIKSDHWQPQADSSEVVNSTRIIQTFFLHLHFVYIHHGTNNRKIYVSYFQFTYILTVHILLHFKMMHCAKFSLEIYECVICGSTNIYIFAKQTRAPLKPLLTI